jgi:hypothetical protein
MARLNVVRPEIIRYRVHGMEESSYMGVGGLIELDRVSIVRDEYALTTFDMLEVFLVNLYRSMIVQVAYRLVEYISHGGI